MYPDLYPAPVSRYMDNVQAPGYNDDSRFAGQSEVRQLEIALAGNAPLTVESSEQAVPAVRLNFTR
jgi:hypothetical protein